jgi:hypothetical protein
MRSTKSKNQNHQIPSEQGRAAEATASINHLSNSFFDDTSAEDLEEILSDMLQMYVNPDPGLNPTRDHLSNVIYAVRRINIFLMKLCNPS